MPSHTDVGVPASTFTAGALADIERALAPGADEVHLTLNLVAPVPPARQVELLEALASQLGLAGA